MFEKLLDPRSVVREAEAKAISGTGGLWDKIFAGIEKVKSGRILPDSVKLEMKQTIDQIYQMSLEAQQRTDMEFGDHAKSMQIEPSRFIKWGQVEQIVPPMFGTNKENWTSEHWQIYSDFLDKLESTGLKSNSENRENETNINEKESVTVPTQ